MTETASSNEFSTERHLSIQRDGRRLSLSTRGLEPGTKLDLLRDAIEQMDEMAASGELRGGGLIGLDGGVPILVAVAVAHILVHQFSAVAVWDPMENVFVVAVSHDPDYPVGTELSREQLRATPAEA